MVANFFRTPGFIALPSGPPAPLDPIGDFGRTTSPAARSNLLDCWYPQPILAPAGTASTATLLPEAAMDPTRFDAFARSLSSRRATLGGLVGGLAALGTILRPEEAEAHNPLPRCRSIKNRKQRTACIRRARKHNRLHRCAQGFANCDGRLATGCETNIQTISNCGGCGIVCTGPPRAAVSCRSGKCTIVQVFERTSISYFTAPSAGTVFAEVLGSGGGSGGKGGEAKSGVGGAGGLGGAGSKVTGTLAVMPGEVLVVIMGKLGTDGGNASGSTGGTGGAGGDGGFSAFDGFDGGTGLAGFGGSGGGGGGGGGGALSQVIRQNNNLVVILAGGGGGGGGGGGAREDATVGGGGGGGGPGAELNFGGRGVIGAPAPRLLAVTAVRVVKDLRGGGSAVR